MRVTVETQPRSFFDKQEPHRLVEGISAAGGTLHEFDDVDNIEQENPLETDVRKREAYDYPTVRITDEDGATHTFESATVDISETDPEVDIWMMNDETASREYASVTHFSGYGIQSNTYTDDFGHERTSHTVFIQDNDGEDTLLGPCSYRGFIVRNPAGETRVIGEPNRHSKNVQHHYQEEPADPPHSNEDGTFMVVADGTLHDDIVNVTRVDVGVFDLHHTDGSRTRTDNITDARGPLYTVVARHNESFGHGTTVTTAKRALGVYVTHSDECLSEGVPALRAVGNPDSAAVCKTPRTYRLSKLEDLDEFFVKTPGGDIIRSLDALHVQEQ